MVQRTLYEPVVCVSATMNHIHTLTFGVVFKYLSSSLSEESVFVQPVLDVAESGDSVPQVVAEGR